MTVWKPDTCDCIIEYNDNINWVSTRKKCRLHKALNGQNLLNQVLAQNRRFNLALGDIQDELDIEETNLSKEVNRLRILTERDLTNFDEELPTEETLTFFQNMKRILSRLNPL